jgi:hypothetical protein
VVDAVSDANGDPNSDSFVASPSCNSYTNRGTVSHANSDADTAEINFLRSCFTLPLVHRACSRICSLPQSDMIP